MNQPSHGMAPSPQSALRWNTLLTRTYGLYRERFLRFFGIALLPAIVAYAYSHLSQIVFQQWFRPSFPRSFDSFWMLLLWTSVVRFVRDGGFWCITRSSLPP